MRNRSIERCTTSVHLTATIIERGDALRPGSPGYNSLSRGKPQQRTEMLREKQRMTMLLRTRKDRSILAHRAFRLALIVSFAAALLRVHAAENCVVATEEEPVAKQPATTPPASNNASQQLLEEFQRTYALPDGQVIKRVPPPSSPGRLEFYRVHDAVQAENYSRRPGVHVVQVGPAYTQSPSHRLASGRPTQRSGDRLGRRQGSRGGISCRVIHRHSSLRNAGGPASSCSRVFPAIG